MSLFDRRVCHDPQSLNGYCRPSVVPTFVASTAIYKYPHGGFLCHGGYLQNHPFKNRIVHQKTIHFGGIPIYEKPHILHIIPSPQYKKPSENHILVGGFTLIWDPKVQVLFSRGLDDPASDPATHGLLLTFPMGNPRLLANLFGDFLWIFVWPSQANPAKIQQKSTKNPPKNAPKIHQKSPNPSFIKDLRPFVLKPLGVWSAVT